MMCYVNEGHDSLKSETRTQAGYLYNLSHSSHGKVLNIIKKGYGKSLTRTNMFVLKPWIK